MDSKSFAAPAVIKGPDSFARDCAIARVRVAVNDMSHHWRGEPSRQDVRALLEAYDDLSELRSGVRSSIDSLVVSEV